MQHLKGNAENSNVVGTFENSNESTAAGNDANAQNINGNENENATCSKNGARFLAYYSIQIQAIAVILTFFKLF